MRAVTDHRPQSCFQWSLAWAVSEQGRSLLYCFFFSSHFLLKAVREDGSYCAYASSTALSPI